MRSNIIALGTIGTLVLLTEYPLLSLRKRLTVSDAASSPNAEPPDNTKASIFSTSLSGSNKSVSLVPGAPPRTL